MYRKKFLPKLLIASVLVGGVNFVPAVVNFDTENLQIISVAYAEVKNITASDTAIFDFGEDDEQIINTVKNVAKMRAIQAAKEKAGVYVKTYTKTVNGVLTDDDISAYASNNITILDVQYKKVPVQAHDVKGNDTGKIAFMYEATVTAKIDTAGLTAYIQSDYKEKQNIIQQNNDSQQNISKISSEFNDLRNSSEDIEQIKSKLNQIDLEVLAQQKLDEGIKLYYEKYYQGAILKYTEAIKLNPNYDLAYYNRGIAYYDLKNYSQAIEDYNQAIRLNPNYVNAYNNRGNAYLKLQNYSQAIEDYTQAIKLNPNYDLAYLNRGCTYDDLKNYSQAIADYNQAIKINPNLAEAYNNRGNAYNKLKNYSQAIEDYMQAIKLNPNDAFAYYNRGCTYGYLENYSQAIKDFSKYIELVPNNGQAYYGRGLCYQKLGRNAEAEKDFAKARELGHNG